LQKPGFNDKQESSRSRKFVYLVETIFKKLKLIAPTKNVTMKIDSKPILKSNCLER